jgi:aspartyl-tRNA(Asn)/glutamyl-tRNA(Gln) amidotransferase subunit A
MSKRRIDWTRLPGDKRAAALDATRMLAQSIEPIICAFVEIEPPRIGVPRGALAHLPYVASDMFALPGRAPTCGLAAAPAGLVPGHATAVARLDTAGAARIGFGEMSSLGLDASGCNALRERPRNPWDPEFIAGGASSGATVAVASGAASIALGADRFGDVRIAAQCLGLTAWKPTRGLVASDGALSLSPSHDVIALAATSAAELERAGPALLDRVPAATLPIERVAVFADVLAAAELRVRKACSDGLDALELAGLALERRPGRDAIAAVERRAGLVFAGELARSLKAPLADARLPPALRSRIAPGLSITVEQLGAAIRDHRRLMKDLADAFFAIAGAIALPVMGVRTPPIAECDVTSPGFLRGTSDALIALTRFVNYLGLPAVAVPVGRDDRGLPVALQIVGRPGWDAALLAMAVRMQEKSQWHGQLPAAVADIVASSPEIAG